MKKSISHFQVKRLSFNRLVGIVLGEDAELVADRVMQKAIKSEAARCGYSWGGLVVAYVGRKVQKVMVR